MRHRELRPQVSENKLYSMRKGLLLQCGTDFKRQNLTSVDVRSDV